MIDLTVDCSTFTPWRRIRLKQMKPFFSLLVCLAMFGCASTAARRIVEQVDPALAAMQTTTEFERRLGALGARIEGDPGGIRTATVLTPASGDFPPRSIRIVYRTTEDGSVRIDHASVLPRLIIEHDKDLTRR